MQCIIMLGLYNFLVQDPPIERLAASMAEFTQTNYKDQLLFDPHAAHQIKKNEPMVGLRNKCLI